MRKHIRDYGGKLMEWKHFTAVLLSLSLLFFSPAALAAERVVSPLKSEASSHAEELPLEEKALPPEESTTEEASPLLEDKEPVKEAETICTAVGDLLETEKHDAYLSGYSDGTFRPKGNITRAEAAQLFYNLLREEPALTADFSDIGTSRWYTVPVRALASLGAIKGYEDGGFHPEANITRAEFVTIASRFSAIREGETVFPDVENHWAKRYIASACAQGWLSGYPDGTFRPNGNITRAEAVRVMNAMLGRVPDAYVQNIYYTVEFDDVARTYWAYPHICEAATSHEYTRENGEEHWDLPDRYDGTGWTLSQGLVCYEDPETGELLRGFQSIGSYTYYFDPETGEARTGWQVIDGNHYLLPDMNQESGALQVSELLTQTNFTASNRSFGDIQYITVHYTAVPNDTARGECQYFETAYRGASAHYFVDENGPWRCVADRDVSWHCGNDVYYHDSCRNYNSIGIEMCSKKIDAAHASSPYDPDWYFAEGTVENTVLLVRELMMKYGVPLEHVVRHNDVSHKTCPAPFVNEFSAWQDFLDQLSDYQTDYDGAYPAEVTATQVNLRQGPGTGYEVVKVLKKGDQVTVWEETGTDGDSQGRWARVDGGWISYPYLCRLG